VHGGAAGVPALASRVKAGAFVVMTTTVTEAWCPRLYPIGQAARLRPCSVVYSAAGGVARSVKKRDRPSRAEHSAVVTWTSTR
jgi:hypothetical protein